MIIETISFSLIFIAYVILAKYHTLQKTWLFALLYAVAFIVQPMSHLWHILYGEDRITCKDSVSNNVFGWAPCFSFTWNYLVNTYELTLPLENFFLTGLAFYVTRTIFEPVREYSRIMIVYILLGVHLVLGVILLFSPPLWLDEGYTRIYDWAAFIVSLVALVTVEVLIEITKPLPLRLVNRADIT